MKKQLFFLGLATLLLAACSTSMPSKESTESQSENVIQAIPAGYVDLGLPSGTLWKEQNEEGGFYTYDEAIAKFGSSLPTEEQWEELENSCSWTWTCNCYIIEGPNGKTITLPADGYKYCDGSVDLVGSDGGYWMSMPDGSESVWSLLFDSMYSGRNYDDNRCNGRSVRLVR